MKIAFLLLMILLSSFSCDHAAKQEEEGINEVILLTRSEIQHKYQAIGRGVGLSALKGIKSMTLYFEIKENIELNKAREIVVESANIFVKNINSNTLLRPFLSEYPFPHSRLHLAFWFTDGSYDQVYVPGILKGVTLSNGQIEYSTASRKGRFEMGDKDVIVLKESFLEAEERLKDEKIINMHGKFQNNQK